MAGLVFAEAPPRLAEAERRARLGFFADFADLLVAGMDGLAAFALLLGADPGFVRGNPSSPRAPAGLLLVFGPTRFVTRFLGLRSRLPVFLSRSSILRSSLSIFLRRFSSFLFLFANLLWLFFVDCKASSLPCHQIEARRSATRPSLRPNAVAVNGEMTPAMTGR